MKGLVKVTPDSLNEIIDSILDLMESFNKQYYAEKEMRWPWNHCCISCENTPIGQLASQFET